MSCDRGNPNTKKRKAVLEKMPTRIVNGQLQRSSEGVGSSSSSVSYLGYNALMSGPNGCCHRTKIFMRQNKVELGVLTLTLVLCVLLSLWAWEAGFIVAVVGLIAWLAWYKHRHKSDQTVVHSADRSSSPRVRGISDLPRPAPRAG